MADSSSIDLRVQNTSAHVTVHSGGPVTGMLVQPDEGKDVVNVPDFVSLTWRDQDDKFTYFRQVSVYLQKREVEFLRDMLTAELANMRE